MKWNRVSGWGRSPALMVATVIATVLLSACGTNPFALSQESVDDHRARWNATGIVDYEYDYRSSCECSSDRVRPARIQVRGGSVTEARYNDSGEMAASMSHYPTVDELFDLIDAAIRDEAAGLAVSYDPQLGYPTGISIDYDLQVVDDEITIDATNLSVL